MSANSNPRKSAMSPVTREFALLLILFLAGIFVLPLIVYLVGSSMFGDYSGTGFTAFYGNLHSELRAGDLAVWFLVLAPYAVWQLLRLTFKCFFRLGNTG